MTASGIALPARRSVGHTTDDDAYLDAYNAYLRKLGDSSGRPGNHGAES
jgi:hypothetical protein